MHIYVYFDVQFKLKHTVGGRDDAKVYVHVQYLHTVE